MCLRVDGQSNRAQRHHLCTGYAGVFLKEHLDPGWRVVSVGGGDVGGGLLPLPKTPASAWRTCDLGENAPTAVNP